MCGVWQGNLIIRGYVQRYNDPPVQSFISMHGPMMGKDTHYHHHPTYHVWAPCAHSRPLLVCVCVLGVAGLPGCNVSRAVCDEVDKLAAKGAYNDFVQQHLAQVHDNHTPYKQASDLSQPPDLDYVTFLCAGG
jgi:hypothetical protein